ncbi:ABC transporter ATP-binding protein [Mesomycoplasma neurolyticum]|uniref:Sugar ABC transporter, ATP-binding protein n=1 Tax=Mesomycoplasma neurolyticum TaxID=2120 RepID=A0A449A577_9BACT|nr:ABC transporter ATP-binding protein [Mesomycoplasma neurolyticum]VEU59405.1 sugar ABC transporter, ATP-binding protein [Mesomycoplasma neurolyticum]
MNKNIDDIKNIDSELEKFINQIGEIQTTSQGSKIELINLSKKYENNDKWTLKDINLTIEPGKFCIFLGPSGCGKTTLLRMIAGLNSITQGDLLFDNKRINNLSPSERNIAMVFQSYALYPHMNVYDNMSFGLKMFKERKDIIDRRVKDVAKILKIENHLYNKPKDLSGGQRQRVAIGRAIVRKPSIFLMDEPLSNLDAKLRESMRREIVQIHRMLNTTSIYVTHDQLEAMTMGDQIVVMNDGKIQQNGTSKELYFKPKNVFVAKFIGMPTINLINGHFKNNSFFAEDFDWSQSISPNLKIIENQKIIIAYRSEDVILNKQKVENSIKGVIYNIESLGKELSIVVKINDSIEIVATVLNNKDFELYTNIYISFDNSRIHIFDAKTEERIN